MYGSLGGLMGAPGVPDGRSTLGRLQKTLNFISISGKKLLLTFAKKRPYTRQHQSRAGGQGQYGSWAGAETEICSPFSSKRPKMRSDYGRTDGPT